MPAELGVRRLMSLVSDSDLQRLRSICSRFPEAEEDLIQDRPLFHVRRRRFAIYNPSGAPYRKRWETCGRSIHFAASQKMAGSLVEDERFYSSPHHGFRGWLGLDLDESSDWNEVADLLLWAYRHVANKSLLQELEGKGGGV